MSPSHLPPAYLCPRGMLTGRSAEHAVAAGLALPLNARAHLAFTLVEVLPPPKATAVAPTLVPAAEVADWITRRQGQERQALEARLAGLTSPISLPSPRERPLPLVMGILNVTPDSFSDGGRFLDRQAAIAHGHQLWQDGADWIDVGGESTRPGAETVPVEEEIQRVVPVIEALAKAGVAVSIDTRKAEVMAAALAAGASMLNDVSALRFDPRAAGVAAASDVPVVLMHSRGEPATMQQQSHYDAAAQDVLDELETSVLAAERGGIPRSRLIVDPGIGFAKTLAHNLDILEAFGLYACLGLPVLIGVSRKSFIGHLAGGAAASERLPGSLGASLGAVGNGAAMVRVHDVAAMRQALAVRWPASLR